MTTERTHEAGTDMRDEVQVIGDRTVINPRIRASQLRDVEGNVLQCGQSARLGMRLRVLVRETWRGLPRALQALRTASHAGKRSGCGLPRPDPLN